MKYLLILSLAFSSFSFANDPAPTGEAGEKVAKEEHKKEKQPEPPKKGHKK